jgi:hypothetical protein
MHYLKNNYGMTIVKFEWYYLALLKHEIMYGRVSIHIL